MTEAQHVALAEVLQNCQGYVVLSGYPSDLYSSLYAGWNVKQTTAMADRQKATTEVLWLSPRVSEALGRLSTQMAMPFAEVL